jgi:endogenous inhibitor of DNA gyrase (YacG/DUF329 family)
MIKKCKNPTCQKEFKTYNSKRKFCSRKCFYEWLKKVSMDSEPNHPELLETRVDTGTNIDTGDK